MSLTPRLRRSVNTRSQNLAPSAFNARSRKAFLNPRNTASNPSGVIGPGTSCSSSSGRIVTAACASTPVPGAFFLAMACSSCLKSRPCTQES